jgi:acyl carrier protein
MAAERSGDDKTRPGNACVFCHGFVTSRTPECNLRILDSARAGVNRRGVNSPVKPTLEKVRRLVIETLPRPAARAPGAVLFGPGGELDSLDLVNFLADLEYRLQEEFGRELVLASEQAMSRRHSPYRDVEALTGYIQELLTS